MYLLQIENPSCSFKLCNECAILLEGAYYIRRTFIKSQIKYSESLKSLNTCNETKFCNVFIDMNVQEMEERIKVELEAIKQVEEVNIKIEVNDEMESECDPPTVTGNLFMYVQ